MTSQLFLGAYWSARQESIEQCADRLFSFFAELTKCDEVFSTWYEKGWSRTQSLEKTAEVSNREYLLELLDRGRHRRDIGHEVIKELGFSFGLWNGREKGNAVDLNIACGLYWASPTPSSRLGNSVTLDLPENLGQLRQTEQMVQVLAAVARAWEPDWAGVMSKESMIARATSATVPFVDWMVYVPDKINAVPTPSSVIPLEGLGSIIIVQHSPPEDTPGASSAIHQIEQILLGNA